MSERTAGKCLHYLKEMQIQLIPRVSVENAKRVQLAMNGIYDDWLIGVQMLVLERNTTRSLLLSWSSKGWMSLAFRYIPQLRPHPCHSRLWQERPTCSRLIWDMIEFGHVQTVFPASWQFTTCVLDQLVLRLLSRWFFDIFTSRWGMPRRPMSSAFPSHMLCIVGFDFTSANKPATEPSFPNS